MASTVEMSASWNVLSETIRRVRNRWRWRLALHGLSVVLGATLLAVLVGSLVIRMFHFAPVGVIGVRVITYVALIALAWRSLVRPLRRRTSDPQVALYLEEHEPSLDAVVVSAVETGTREAPAFVRSSGLIARLVDTAAARVTAIGDDVHIETRSIRQSLLTLLGILATGAFLMGTGPEFLRTGAFLLAAPGMKVKRNVFVVVQPGDAKVGRGGNQEIRARLHGFDADHAELVMQRGTGKWERLPMSIARDSAAFVIRLFALQERTTYYVDVGGVRSPIYHLDIVELPYVKRLALAYHYPAYTGLAPKTEVNGGDINAPEGTSVAVHATTTVPVRGGRIIIAGQPPVPLMLGADGTLTGKIPVTKPGFYKIELEASNGGFVPGSLDYNIDVVKDAPPTIVLEEPGHDKLVTLDDVVTTRVKATDDYGVAKIDIKYSVNGGPERSVSLPTSPVHKEVVTGYAFPLKQLGFRAGDVVSYYAQATDNDAVHGGQTATTDIYFLTVLADLKKTVVHIQNKSGETPPQLPYSPHQLLRKQREILVGTFNADRDRAQTSSTTRRQNATMLALAQRQLREHSEEVIAYIIDRDLPKWDHPDFQVVADELSKATKEMRVAEGMLAGQDGHAALSAEQRAQQHLQIAVTVFNKIPDKTMPKIPPKKANDQDELDSLAQTDLLRERKKQLSQQGQQYETTPKNSQQSERQAIDSLVEKLAQLARRQKNQERALRADSLSFSQGQPKPADTAEDTWEQVHNLKGKQERGPGGNKGPPGQAQASSLRIQVDKEGRETKQFERELAKKVNATATQLEQRAREQPNNQALHAAARDLWEAADALRRAVSGTDPKQASQAIAQALQKLQEARTVLEQERLNGDPRQKILARASAIVQSAGAMASNGNRSQGMAGLVQDAQNLTIPLPGTEQLQQLLKHTQSLESPRSVFEGLKKWEYLLRQKLEGDIASHPALGNTDDVPPDFKTVVSEYYKSLAKEP